MFHWLLGPIDPKVGPPRSRWGVTHGEDLLRRSLLSLTVGALLALTLTAPLRAADEDDFYRGKTITIIIPIGPGGAYDAYARLVSRHLGKQLAGNPVRSSRNLPGGGGVIASNHLYNVAPQDGTTLTIITSSFANEQLFGNPQIRYDARNSSPSAACSTPPRSCSSGIPRRSRRSMTCYQAGHHGGLIGERDSGLPAPAMNRYLGTQFKPIPGYPSARDFVMAAERGETDGGIDLYRPVAALLRLSPREEAQHPGAVRRHSATPTCRTCRPCSNSPSDPEATQIFQHLVTNDEIGRSLFTTPNVPAARLAAAPRLPGDARRRRLPGRGRAAQVAARRPERRGDAEGRRRPV